jgi:hypothetical protein
VIDRMIRARITVEPLRDGLVCVREHRGNRIEIETFAVRDACGNWLWDQSGRLVDDRVAAAIRSAS